MAKLSYDLTEIPDIVELEQGRATARLVACTKGKSKASGNPTLTWEWMFLTGPNKGTRGRSWTSLQDHALGGLKQHLMAFGYKKVVDIDTEDLIGKKVTLVVGTRPRKLDDGRTINQSGVTAVLPLQVEEVADDDDDEEERPKKKKAPVEEEEEEEEAPKPKKKKVVEEEEEEEAPAPKKKFKTVAKREEEEEDEEPKPKKKKPSDDDEEPF